MLCKPEVKKEAGAKYRNVISYGGTRNGDLKKTT
jgi:hypothetical protein